MRLVLYAIAAWIGVEVLTLAVVFAVASWEERHPHMARAILLSEWRSGRSGTGQAPHEQARRKTA